MSRDVSGIPPSEGQNPKPEDLQKTKQTKAKETPTTHSGNDLGFKGLRFSEKDYYKFLAQMASMMIHQIKHNSDLYIQALRKMRENQ